MNWRYVVTSLTGLSLACATLGIGYATIPEAPALLAPRLATATVWTHSPVVGDTLVMEARWHLPADDGRGPLDSITVNFTNLQGPGAVRVTVPGTAIAATLRQPLPTFDATWEVTAQVCTWRRVKMTCVYTMATYVHTEAPPPGVDALTLTLTKVP